MGHYSLDTQYVITMSQLKYIKCSIFTPCGKYYFWCPPDPNGDATPLRIVLCVQLSAQNIISLSSKKSAETGLISYLFRGSYSPSVRRALEESATVRNQRQLLKSAVAYSIII